MGDYEKALQFLTTQKHMVLAVVLDDGTPWVVPVKIQMRDGLRIFEWDSRLETTHSQALTKHPAMAITIFQKEPTAQIGIYATGRGELVEEKGKYGRYRFTTEKAWLNDETFVKREIMS